MPPSPFDLQKGTDYDLKSPAIACMADREGAQVFEVFEGRKWWRVLAYSLSEAADIALEHVDSNGLNW